MRSGRKEGRERGEGFNFYKKWCTQFAKEGAHKIVRRKPRKILVV
jgi:hypothetical protein